MDLPTQPDRPPSSGKLSDQMRALLARPSFRDAATQVQHEAMRDQLIKDLRAEFLLQFRLIDELSVTYLKSDQLRRVVEAAVDRQMLDAAREVLNPDFGHFYPPPPGTLETNGVVATAFGEFMSHPGKAIVEMSEAEVKAKAIARLAAEGRDETALRDRAYVLALPELEKLQKLADAYHRTATDLLSQLIVIADRREERAARREAAERAASLGKAA